jgi:hypothetical protein
MFPPLSVQEEHVVDDPEHRMHFKSQLLHRLGLVVEYVPSGHAEEQVLFQRYAMFPPLNVQDEQVVNVPEHKMHFGSQLLHRLGAVVEYVPSGHVE